MKKTLIAAGLSAMTLLSAGIAAAQPGAGQPAPKADLQRAKLVERLDARFAKFDANKDGTIATAELKAARDARIAQQFKRLDTDGNGAITLAEMQVAHDKRAGHARQGDDKRHAHFGKRGHGFRHAGSMGALRDANGDGLISKAEFEGPALARFDKMDADHNGVVTAAERQAAREAMKAQRARN